MIEVFKILKGYITVGDGSFLQLAPRDHQPETRGHSLKLRKLRYRTMKRSEFFNVRIVNKWNSLTEYVVSSPNTNIFKYRYDQCETLN